MKVQNHFCTSWTVFSSCLPREWKCQIKICTKVSKSFKKTSADLSKTPRKRDESGRPRKAVGTLNSSKSLNIRWAPNDQDHDPGSVGSHWKIIGLGNFQSPDAPRSTAAFIARLTAKAYRRQVSLLSLVSPGMGGGVADGVGTTGCPAGFCGRTGEAGFAKGEFAIV